MARRFRLFGLADSLTSGTPREPDGTTPPSMVPGAAFFWRAQKKGSGGVWADSHVAACVHGPASLYVRATTVHPHIAKAAAFVPSASMLR